MRKQIYSAVVLILISAFSLSALTIGSRDSKEEAPSNVVIINNTNECIELQPGFGGPKKVLKGHNSILINNSSKQYQGIFNILIKDINLNYLNFEFSEKFKDEHIEEDMIIALSDSDSWEVHGKSFAISKKAINEKAYKVKVEPHTNSSEERGRVTIDYV